MNYLELDDLATNKTYRCEYPLEIRLERALDSPAAGFYAVLKDVPAGDYGTIRWVLDGRCDFSGIVDEARTVLDQSGLRLELEARESSGILDNHARPGTVWGANLSTMFARHIAPYGLSLEQTLPPRSLPEFTIRPGQSEWQAFAAFCGQLYGILPYVCGSTVHCCLPRGAHGGVISNNGGIPFTKVEHRRIPCKLISKVYLRDAQGSYSSSVSSSTAGYFRQKRERYWTPGSENREQIGRGANQILEGSLWESEEYCAELPQWLEAQPGDLMDLDHPGFQRKNLMVYWIDCRLSAAGEHTRLILRNQKHWKGA